MAKEQINSVEDQLKDAIFEVLKRNYSSNITSATIQEASGDAVTAALNVAASLTEACGISTVEMLTQVRNQIDANIEELKQKQTKEQNFDMMVFDLRSCIDSALDRNKIHGQKAKDVLQRAVAKWLAHYVAMNYGKGEEQALSGICNELKHEAIEEFCVLDAEIQANGDALLEE